jgi:acetoin:2,6-dichlorophenolindophenol oxidoreductase subunit beta
MEKMNMIQAINRALHDAMEADETVLALGEEVADPEGGGIVGVTKGLSDRFGEDRVLSTPISEQAIIGSAVGAAIAGFRPVAELMLMNFSTVAMDMLVNHAAKLRFMSGGQTNVPMVVRTATGAGLGTGGQHCDFLEAWFAHTAGMKVVIPSNPSDAYGLMRSAIEDEDPVIFVENIPLYFTPTETALEKVPLGKAKVVKEGTDLTIVAYALMVHHALAVAAELEQEGKSVEVIDLRTIAPWDKETVLASVGKTGRLLIVHEAVTEHGVGAEIAAVVNKDLFGKLKAPVDRLGAAFCAVPFSKPLESAFVPNPQTIGAAARALLG